MTIQSEIKLYKKQLNDLIEFGGTEWKKSMFRSAIKSLERELEEEERRNYNKNNV